MRFVAILVVRLALVPVSMFGRFRCGSVAAFVAKPRTSSGLNSLLLRSHLRTPRHTFVGVLASAIDRSVDTTNQDLVQRRLQVEHAKREARQQSIQRKVERNLQLKRFLSTQAATATSSSSSIPALYAIKVTVSDELRSELLLNGREKRGRVFVEVGSDAVKSIRALRQELHSFFRALRKNTYVLQACFPEVSENGTVSIPENPATTWSIETDDDVMATFAKADKHYRDHASILNRPTIVIHVHRDPNAPPPPPPPSYLNDMADPLQSPTMTMLSFYAFPPNGIDDPDDFAMMLRKVWKPFKALGRVYVAYEGINAQMSVPTNVLENFEQCCASIPELGSYMENGFNVDPIPLTREEFATAGSSGSSNNPQPPFKNLYIRVRRQVVADGLDQSYNWQAAGYDMPPLEWHHKIKTAKEKREQGCNDGLPIILDCRNTYETDIGTFEGAEPLNTDSFRESWKVLAERLANVPKDADIMTFCTGGIRCVKVGAYLTQELGFTNVSRLAAGIIGYDRTLQETAPHEDSMFKGTNFVFDGRLGRPITEDALGTCITCGAETSLICNCRNENCHKRIIQCETCRTSFHGTCSDACRQRLLNGAMTPLRSSSSSNRNLPLVEQDPNQPPRTLEDYSAAYSSPLPSVYHELMHNTKALIPSGSHMISEGAQGRLLTQFASMTREGRVLELGTFTAYATACLLEGVLNAATATESTPGSRMSGPYVMTMERDDKAYAVAVNHLRVLSAHGFTEEGAEHLAQLRQSTAPAISPIDDTCVSLSCGGFVACDVVHVSDALASIEEMAAGRGDLQPAPFDLVYVDADKTRLLDYVDVFLSSDKLLKTGGFIIVDNVLYKGLVLEAAGGGTFPSLADNANASESDLRRNRRARRLANKMHRFNEAMAYDDRAEILLLPLRDGLSVVRKK